MRGLENLFMKNLAEKNALPVPLSSLSTPKELLLLLSAHSYGHAIARRGELEGRKHLSLLIPAIAG